MFESKIEQTQYIQLTQYIRKYKHALGLISDHTEYLSLSLSLQKTWYGVGWYGLLLERVLEAHEACRRWRCSTLSDPDGDGDDGDGGGGDADASDGGGGGGNEDAGRIIRLLSERFSA